ncbi:oxidoreductase [Coniophora puteana RWD-64-598 SS2]|uniref:Oxidoreductase n=1 Tax=Coniophora puteana (strain RWD-64-598) TaxID=741705 RepID=A0A5M3MRJ5_CONPW|nr:oxidoreductase [Coniophora puteana RWD-64-598 SS2]EIW81773.1 oxidoreductase [Coniophora puteana RWD-64-598 SS2]
MLFSKKWDPKDKHVYVTGGSQGLGLALAILLVKREAHVSIVARNQERLDNAKKQIEAARVSPSQQVHAFSFSLNSASESAAALKAASDAFGGRAPDAVFACAGAAKPMYVMEMSEEDMTKGMMDGYWVQAWTAFAAAKEMTRQGVKGKIVLVSSTLGLMSFVGWASYAPAKHALRGLADTLRSELLLYGIDVHIFFPPTMNTASYEEEMKTKPFLTRKIEETDGGLSSDQAALGMFKGVESGHAHIAADLITHLFRASTRGSAPMNNVFVDTILDFIALIGVPIWRRGADRMVLGHRKEHVEYLEKKGFFA